MTKNGIAGKLRHCSTPLVASLISFVCLCPFIGFSDSFVTSDGKISCTYGNGTASCQALSDDVDLDCMARIRSILSNCSSVADSLYFASLVNSFNKDDSLTALQSLSSITPSTSEDYDYNLVKRSLENISWDCDNISNHIESARSASSSTVDVLRSFSCSDCDDVSMSCCCCSNNVYYSDFSFQITNLVSIAVSLSNSVLEVSDTLQSSLAYASSINSNVSNILSALTGSFGGFSSSPNGQWYRLRYTTSRGLAPTLVNSGVTTLESRNVISLLGRIQVQLNDFGSSINNYLYKISEFYLPSLTNDVSALTHSATNFFSFFVTNISVKSVLGDWVSGTYYDFLTNHYIKVSRDDFSGMSDSQQSKTNWFARIETLIASLVFAESVESTNTVDSSQAESESSNILSETLDGVNDVKAVSSSQLSVFRDTSQNIISSLRSISSSFSSVADPGTVNLVRLSSSDTRDSSDSVSFETSDIRNLVEACHCVTTLCWCLGGLLLLYFFFHWTVKTSYGLVMFAWGVFSAIFKH